MSLEKCSLKPQWETTSHLRLLQCKDQKQQHIIRVDRINKWWENVETLEPCILLGRMEDDVATVEKSSQIPQKVKITIWPGNTTPRSTPKRIASRVSNRYLHMNSHISTIHNSQKGDATQTFITGAVDKQTVLHTQLPLKQHRFELHRSTYNWIFFNKYILWHVLQFLNPEKLNRGYRGLTVKCTQIFGYMEDLNTFLLSEN